MMILDPGEVKPCSVNNQGRWETGIRAYGKAFRLSATYQPNQLKNALAHCRANLEQNVLSVIVRQPTGYTVWLQSAERVGEAIS